MESTDEKFSSQDIPLTAFLHARGHKILEQSEPDSSNRITFTFKKTDSLLEDLYNYGNNAAIPIQNFYRSLSLVWNLIKEKKENGGRQ